MTLTTLAAAAALVAGVFSVVATTTTATVAGAATTPVAASWSSTPGTSGFVTATPPPGAVSATVTLSGGGGGGGGTDDNTSNGGAGGEVTGTFALTHSTGQVAVELGGGGGGGHSCDSDFSSCTASGSSGGTGFEAGGGGGQSESETASVQGSASGGAGGAASGLYLGSNSSGTLVAVAGGGGGGGGEWGCDGDQTNGGTGGAGDTGGSGASSAGATGGTSGDSEGGGSGGAAGGAPGAGATSSTHDGGNEGTSSAGGDGGGAGPSTGQGGQDHCTTGEDASGGGGGGGSVAPAPYDSSVSYTSGAAGGSSGNAGGSGSISLTWNVASVSITTPAAQTSTSGSAISPLPVSATDSDSLGLTYSASGLPAGLSINSSTGVISGTPTTGSASASSVVVTATDSQAATASTSAFNWTVDNSVSVTGKSAQSNVTGSAITPLADSATDSQAGASLTWSATGLPAGLSISSSTGTISGTPTTAGSNSVVVEATDGAGFSGTTSFSWTITNTIAVANPGNQSSLSGSAITPLADSATDSQAGASLTWSATGLPAGLGISSSTGTITGTPTTAGSNSVVVKAADASGASGTVSFTWAVTNTVSVANPGDQSSTSGTAISPLAISASDSSSSTTLSYADNGTLPTGLSIDSSTGAITGTPTTAGTYPVTITVTDGAGFSSTTSFSWSVTNTIGVTNPGAQSSLSGGAITTLPVAATDSSGSATLTYGATGLPAGLSIDPSTGAITGTPTTAGLSSVTVTVSDASGASTSVSFSWTITNTVAVANPGSQSNVTGSAITAVTNSATDSSSTAAITSWSASGLPAGLSIDSTTGTISGTPTTAGSYSVTLTATDDAGDSGNATFTWLVGNAVTVVNPGDQSAVSGAAIDPLSISASDSGSGVTLGYSDNGTLPPGLSVDPTTGAITGTPTTAGTYPVTITVTDSAGFAGSAAFTWTVTNAVTVANPGSQSSQSGSAITTLTNSASDSSSTATIDSWSASGLPAGLSIDSTTGTVSGTPTTAGSSTVTVTATDSAGFVGSATFTWVVTDDVSVTNPGDQSDVSGSAISPISLAASDTSAGATLSYSDNGTLPTGLAIDPTTGVISGTPTTAGTTAVTITVTDNGGFSASTTFNWTISNTVGVSNPGAQSSVSGSPITPLTVTSSDTSAVATLSYADNGTLPTGLSIDPTTGSISGTPTTAGTYPVTVTATDSSGFAGSASFDWTVTNTVAATTPGDQSSTSGAAITALTVSASDSSPVATLSYADNGTLPTGLSIDPTTGTISGTPTTAGTYPVTITVTDNSGASTAASFDWTVTNTVSVTNPGDQSSTSGAAVTALTVSASDSSPVATLSYTDHGTLPAGLSIDPTTGVITGTPTTAGSYAVTVTVTDNAGLSGSASFNWTIANTVSVTNPGDQSSTSGAAVTALTVSASDSSPVATLSYTDNGTLPTGLSIDPTTGTIAGTPTTAGTYPVTITVTDDAGFAGTASLTWTVANTVSVTTPGDQSSTSGAAITALPVSASDSSSTATLGYSDNGTLPTGLSIDPTTGTIAGTPTTAGTYPVTITVTDDAGFVGSVSFTWTVTNAVTVVSPGDQSSTSGAAITALPVSASDSSSTATLGYSDNGTLPTGLSIDPTTGTIAGTPTTAGTYPVTITVTDNSGATGSASFTWTVANAVSVTNPGDQSNTSGAAITALPVSASDSSPVATLGYADNGTLPTGLSIDPTTGTISGTPTTAGTYPVTITVTDNSGATGSASFTWTVANSVSVTTPGNQSSTSGTAITPLPVSASDSSSTATLGYSDNGTLPAGLSIDPTTGVISGNPTTGGTYPVTITVTDSSGFSAQASFTWAVANTVTVAPIANQDSDTGVQVTSVKATATDSQTAAPSPILEWTASGLPDGLSIAKYTGLITGTPTAAGTYSVTVTATENVITTDTGSTTFTWSVVDVAPVISSVSKSGGPGAGGTKVKIVGIRFDGVTSVAFGNVNATSFKVNKKGTQITAVSPPEAAGTVDISVTAVGGTSGPTSADQFTYGGPSITGVKPSAGSAAGGTKVTITGSDLQQAGSVLFGSTPAASFTVNRGGTKIVAYSPSGSIGTVDIVVTTAGGSTTQTAADQYSYVGPVVTAVKPSSGPVAGGKKVTITGTGLEGATSVTFGSVPATGVKANGGGTKVTAVAPPGTAGTVAITVTTPAGVSPASSSAQYTYGA